MMVTRVLFFLLLITFSYNHVFNVGINIYLSDLPVIAILAFTLLRWIGGADFRKYRPFVFPFAILFLYYLFLIFYSYAIYGNSINDVLGRFRNLFFYPLLFFSGVAFTTRRRDLNKYFTLIKIYISIAVTIGVAGIFHPSFSIVKIYGKGDAGKGLVDSLYFMIVDHGTALLCCLVFIHEFLCLLRKPKKITGSLFFMVMSVIGMIGTQNRSILIVFLFSFFLIFWYTRKADRFIKVRMNILAFFILVLLAGGIFVIVNTSLYEKFEPRVTKTLDLFSDEQEFFNTIPGVRVGRTIATFNAWMETPVLGCGWGNQITEFDIYDLQGNYVRTNYGTPHNYYMTILYQTGITGFLIMMFIFYRIYRNLKPHTMLNPQNTMDYAFFVFYFAFLLFNFANTHLYSHPVFIPFYFFLLGAAVSNSYLKRGDRRP